MGAAPRFSSRRRIFLPHRIEYQLRASQVQLVASPESGNSAPGNPRPITPGKPGKLKGVGKSGSYLDDLAPGSVRAALESAGSVGGEAAAFTFRSCRLRRLAVAAGVAACFPPWSHAQSGREALV